MICLILAFTFIGCNESSEKNSFSRVIVSQYQRNLIDAAFKTASAIPMDPHIKDRSKSQQNVIAACLEIDQPHLALSYVEKIDNWRRNLCYAEIACYFAENDRSDQASRYIQSAEKFPDQIEDWRKDRIENKITQAKNLLTISKQDGSVNDIPGNGPNSFEEKFKTLENTISSGSIPALKNGLYAYAGLYNHYYENIQRRELIEDKIKTAWKDVPAYIKIDLLVKLAESAIEHGHTDNSNKHLSQASELLVNNKWRVKYRVPTLITFARLLHRSGDSKKAYENLSIALKIFNDRNDEIFDIYRAAMLCKLAEAYCLIGDKPSALSVYKQAIEAGAVNINSRPRAQDISAICCSMAVNSVEPDEQLWIRINQIIGGLANPW
ncbi:MAG: tetratricopeptide repeat protein [Phycisphaerae bacterium]|nr:tetratricopeptide repeat protein [Phycisphaerae bacterium]